MSVSSISSSMSQVYAPQQQSNVASAQPVPPDKGSDSDKDDSVKAAAASPSPSVNLDGQVVGKTINTTA